MTSIKKTLLVSCSAGSGHLKAAEALLLSLKQEHPEITIEHLDLTKHTNWLVKLFITDSYDWVIKNCPFIYGLLYHLTNNKIFFGLLYFFSPLLKLGQGQFYQKIKEFNPDLIVSTYFLSSWFIPKNFRAPLDTLITDYQFHYLWLAPHNRNIFVATKEIKDVLKNKTKSNVIVSGLPLRPAFLQEKNNDKIQEKLGLQKNWPTILVMPCNSGKISAEKMLQKIITGNKNFNILAIAGPTNQGLYQKFQRIPRGENNLITWQFSEEIDELMRVSDVIITKAGGITVTECLYLQKPVIIVNPIPGQEEFNVEFLEKNKYGFRLKNIDEINEKIKEILAEPHQVNKPPPLPDANKIIWENALKEKNTSR